MSEAIPSWARIGQKVVCVDDADSLGRFYNATGASHWVSVLRKGEVYTICGFEPHPFWDGLCVQIAEEPEKHAYALRRFRPLVSQADDIATHFAHHLDTRAPELV